LQRGKISISEKEEVFRRSAKGRKQAKYMPGFDKGHI
jgi:hypothetical protein